jgi:hypothetical protein
MSRWDSPEAFIGAQEVHKMVMTPEHGQPVVVTSEAFMGSQQMGGNSHVVQVRAVKNEVVCFIVNQVSLWSIVLDKPMVTELVKKFNAFYGNQRFITVLTSHPCFVHRNNICSVVL